MFSQAQLWFLAVCVCDPPFRTSDCLQGLTKWCRQKATPKGFQGECTYFRPISRFYLFQPTMWAFATFYSFLSINQRLATPRVPLGGGGAWIPTGSTVSMGDQPCGGLPNVVKAKKNIFGDPLFFFFFFCCALISFRLALFDVRFWPHRFNSIFEANRLRSQSSSFIPSSLGGRRGVGGRFFLSVVGEWIWGKEIWLKSKR